jgi:hypothetical protein
MVGRARATRRAALYVRVSASDRGQSNQLAPLQEVAARLGWTREGHLCDEGNSGAQAALSGQDDHTIRHAALAYSVMPFSSYV